MIKGQYEEWCETRRRLQDLSILDHLKGIVPDVRLEEALGPRVPPNWPPKANPKEGWFDPEPIDDLVNEKGLGSVVLDRPAMKPGTTFASKSTKPIGLGEIQEFSQEAGKRAAPDGFVSTQPLQFRASSTFPLMSSMLVAHARLFALKFALNPVGLSAGSMTIYRYSYMAEKARKSLAFIADIDGKMMTMQFELDDFAELIETIRRHIDENSAELQALETRISELQTTISTLNKGEEEIGKAVEQLSAAADECDVEWWEIFVSVVVVIAATAVGAGIGFLLGGGVGAIGGGLTALGLSLKLTVEVWLDRDINCDNVSQAHQDFQSAQSALQASITDLSAELNHALLQRDVVITELASLQDAYDEAVTSNQARVFNATTLSHILGVLDSVRSTTVMRAHSLARMAQDAYNAENDTKVNIIAAVHSDYLDKDARGYTAAAVLQRDLDGLEHIRLTGRTRKHMQLTHLISFRKHYPTAFASLLTSGHARFATRLSDFDRWFPGAYMQRLKEVRVDILVDQQSQPIRGYLTNDGASFVRFSDHGNKIKIDERDVVAEPDEDLRKLCYKRRRRHHAVETMAFPSFESFLFEARAAEMQQQERNFFEGCGLESTWHLELMPDQLLEHAHITDVQIHFQFEALFDPALKSVVEAKRYKDRNETALVSIRKLLEERGARVDFSQPIEANVSAFMFEAPHLDKTIRDVGIMLRPKQAPLLTGKVKLGLNYQDQTVVEVETNEQGIVATADAKPAGTNTSALRGLTQDKSIVGLWSIQILEMPPGFQLGDIDDVLLMIRYAFKQA
jgi:prefoldin subunit 5